MKIVTYKGEKMGKKNLHQETEGEYGVNQQVGHRPLIFSS
jgi:hypothetical protein